MQSGHAGISQESSIDHKRSDGCPTPASSVASNSEQDINKLVSAVSTGMPAPAPRYQSMEGPAATSHPVIQQRRENSRNPVTIQTPAYYPRNTLPPRSFMNTIQNPTGAVVNQSGQQPSSQYGSMPIIMPQQPNFTSPQPTMSSPQFPQMFQQTAYNPSQYPIMANQQYLLNYIPQYQNSIGYYPSRGLSNYQTMSTQIPHQFIPAQLQQQHVRKEENYTPIIHPKTGKNVVTGGNRPEDNNTRSIPEKESENSDSNICLQLATQLVTFLNGSGDDTFFKQPESVRIDAKSSGENEEMRMQENPVDKNISGLQRVEGVSEVDITESRNLLGNDEEGGPCNIIDIDSSSIDGCESGVTKGVNLESKKEGKKQNVLNVSTEFSVTDTEEFSKSEESNITYNPEKMVGFTETKQINAKYLIDPDCTSSTLESLQPIVEGAKEEPVLPSTDVEDCSVRPKRVKEYADFYRRNIAPPPSFSSLAGNPTGAVINQPAQQPSFPYMLGPTIVPLQPNIAPFPPTMLNPELQMNQQTSYNLAQYPIMANQQYLWNYNIAPPPNLNGYYASHRMPSFQTMPPQMPAQSISTQSQQDRKKEEKASTLIDSKAGKKVRAVNKKAEDSSCPNRGKESENSDSNICLQLTTQLAAYLNDIPCDVTFKQHEPVIAIVASLLLLLREKQRKAKAPVPPLPVMTTVASSSVSTPASEKKSNPIPIENNEISNDIPTAGENSNTTSQNDLSANETTCETSLVEMPTEYIEEKKNTVEPKENKIVLRLSYKEDQWSPLNPEGKKHYHREFLLQLQSHPFALCKPNNLPNLMVIKDKAHIQKLTEMNRTPYSAVNNPPPDATVNQLSQGKGGKKSKKIISFPSDQNIKLHKSPNPWRPLHKCEIPLDENDRLKRSVLSVLNKLTPQKFETLLGQLNSLIINTEEKLYLFCNLVFEKAVYEPKFSAVYANLSKHLALVAVSGTSDTEVNFGKLLIQNCQKEVELDRSNELEEKMKNLEATDSNKKKELEFEYYEEEKKIGHRKLGNIRFIGELFKLSMLSEPIMHEYIKKFLRQGDETSLEYLSRLFKTTGKELDDEKSIKNKYQMDIYFLELKLVVDNRLTGSRVRFLLQDTIDLRKNNWVPRRVEDNPKLIEEIHEEVKREALEQQLVCQKKTKRRKNTVGIRSSEDGWTSSPESNKSRYSKVNPSKLKLSKPDEVECIRLGPGGRGLQSWGRGSSGGADKIPAINGLSALSEQSVSAKYEGRRGSQESAASSRESSRGRNSLLSPTIKKTPSTFKEGENLLETFKGLRRTSETKAPEAKPANDVHMNANAVARDELALTGPEYNRADIERKTKSLIQEFLQNKDFEKAIKWVTELASPNTVFLFIDFAIDQALEGSSQTRCSLGQLLSSLLKKKIITFDQYKKGFSGVLEIIDDYALDIPLICDYMGEILEPLIEDIETPFKSFKEVLQPCIPSEKAGRIVSSILYCAARRKDKIKIGEVWRESGVQWTDIIGTDRNVTEFIEKNELEFTLSPTKVPLRTQMSLEEMKKHLLSLLERNAKLEEVVYWVDANVSDISGSSFVRALVTAVHGSCLSGSGTTWELNTSKLKSRIPLISRYIATNETLQLQALYALQALMNQLGQPSGLLHQIFDVLYDYKVIYLKSFKEWEQSDDLNEAEGKGVAVHSVKSFFTWLREPEDETEEINSV